MTGGANNPFNRAFKRAEGNSGEAFVDDREELLEVLSEAIVNVAQHEPRGLSEACADWLARARAAYAKARGEE